MTIFSAEINEHTRRVFLSLRSVVQDGQRAKASVYLLREEDVEEFVEEVLGLADFYTIDGLYTIVSAEPSLATKSFFKKAKRVKNLKKGQKGIYIKVGVYWDDDLKQFIFRFYSGKGAGVGGILARFSGTYDPTENAPINLQIYTSKGYKGKRQPHFAKMFRNLMRKDGEFVWRLDLAALLFSDEQIYDLIGRRWGVSGVELLAYIDHRGRDGDRRSTQAGLLQYLKDCTILMLETFIGSFNLAPPSTPSGCSDPDPRPHFRKYFAKFDDLIRHRESCNDHLSFYDNLLAGAGLLERDYEHALANFCWEDVLAFCRARSANLGELRPKWTLAGDAECRGVGMKALQRDDLSKRDVVAIQDLYLRADQLGCGFLTGYPTELVTTHQNVAREVTLFSLDSGSAVQATWRACIELQIRARDPTDDAETALEARCRRLGLQNRTHVTIPIPKAATYSRAPELLLVNKTRAPPPSTERDLCRCQLAYAFTDRQGGLYQDGQGWAVDVLNPQLGILKKHTLEDNLAPSDETLSICVMVGALFKFCSIVAQSVKGVIPALPAKVTHEVVTRPAEVPPLLFPALAAQAASMEAQSQGALAHASASSQRGGPSHKRARTSAKDRDKGKGKQKASVTSLGSTTSSRQSPSGSIVTTSSAAQGRAAFARSSKQAHDDREAGKREAEAERSDKLRPIKYQAADDKVVVLRITAHRLKDGADRLARESWELRCKVESQSPLRWVDLIEVDGDDIYSQYWFKSFVQHPSLPLPTRVSLDTSIDESIQLEEQRLELQRISDPLPVVSQDATIQERVEASVFRGRVEAQRTFKSTRVSPLVPADWCPSSAAGGRASTSSGSFSVPLADSIETGIHHGLDEDLDSWYALPKTSYPASRRRERWVTPFPATAFIDSKGQEQRVWYSRAGCFSRIR